MTLSYYKKLKNLKEIIVQPYLDQLEREDKFFGERFSWLMTFQGFLITPLTLIATNIDRIKGTEHLTYLHNLEIFLTIVGVGSIFSISSGCYAGYESTTKLIDTVINKLQKINELEHEKIKIEDLLIFKVISPDSRFLGLLPSFGNILLICLFWAFVTWNLKVDSHYILIKWVLAGFLLWTTYQCLNILLVRILEIPKTYFIGLFVLGILSVIVYNIH